MSIVLRILALFGVVFIFVASEYDMKVLFGLIIVALFYISKSWYQFTRKKSN